MDISIQTLVIAHMKGRVMTDVQITCKVIPHRRAFTLRAAKGLRPFGIPVWVPCAKSTGSSFSLKECTIFLGYSHRDARLAILLV
jgi:hypothetical protein